MASLSLFQNECPLKGLAVVASDLPRLSNKIAYHEWNRMEKKADSHSLKCCMLEGFITRRKVAQSSSRL